LTHSASSAVSPDEKVLVVANLYDGLDWYKIPDRTFSRSVPLRINHNVPIPVLLVDGGKFLLVGGTSGTVKVLDAKTAETVQTLDHDRKTAKKVFRDNANRLRFH
jgi:WD40 repeat protein